MNFSVYGAKLQFMCLLMEWSLVAVKVYLSPMMLSISECKKKILFVMAIDILLSIRN